MSVRKIGVEEELMLVDPGTGELTAVSQKAVRAHEQGSDQVAVGVGMEGQEPGVEHELFLQQIETTTTPHESVDDVAEEIRLGRRAVGQSAREAGAAAVAMSAPVLVDPQQNVTPKPRYERIYEEFGEIAKQSMVCAMHVHVDVDGDEEGVAVIDRVRPWLPVLLALSANSPFWRGGNTGYASWRAQVWTRWPSNGSSEPFGDLETYRRVSSDFVSWGAAFDPGMIYFDVRLAEKYPTVEIRVADVCTEVEDAGMVAALARGLVETAARAHQAGDPAPGWRSDQLRVANWRASRYGTGGRLVNPDTMQLGSVREVFAALLDHTRAALDDAGDREMIETCFERLLSRGNGAVRQRAVFEATGDLRAVVKDLRERTEVSWGADR
ncbi:MAG TPA: glutamate--cysteine ligase [Nocardioidaceae bacterium]|nr:glutamate--cysteine ligase [Nocardioidaceae bacterium]